MPFNYLQFMHEGFRLSGPAAAILGSWSAKCCWSKTRASSLETLLEWRQTWRQTKLMLFMHMQMKTLIFPNIRQLANFNLILRGYTYWNMSGRKVFFSFETDKNTLTFNDCWRKFDRSNHDVCPPCRVFVVTGQTETRFVQEKSRRFYFVWWLRRLDVLSINVRNFKSLQMSVWKVFKAAGSKLRL